MAVYTDVSDADLTRFLAEYDLGGVLSCKGIAEGVENSNFLLRTERGNFILTLYEKRVRETDLPFFLAYMEHLASRGVACPLPVHGRDGKALRRLCGRPAAIVTFLEGLWPREIMGFHCGGVGTTLARLHAAGRDFAGGRGNDLSIAGWRDLADRIGREADRLEPGLAAEIAEELAALESAWPRDLPRGIVHADLFPDNVFFQAERVSGVIDFYFACTDFLAYDLAICLNAWCFDAASAFVADHAHRLVTAYQAVRPLEPAERAGLPLLARGAAMRFLLTRLHDWLFPQVGALVRAKDPREYLARLRFHRAISGAASYGV